MCTKKNPATTLCDAQFLFLLPHGFPSLFIFVFFCCSSCVDYENQYAYRNCIFKAHANGKFELWYSWIVKRGSNGRLPCFFSLWENALLLFAKPKRTC